MRDQRKDKTRSDNVDCFISNFHSVIAGISSDELNDEDMDLCRFMVGGMQAK